MLWQFRQVLGEFIKNPRLRSGPKDVAVYEGLNLIGDRDIEWGYIATRLGRYAAPGATIMDFGCERGVLTCAAAQVGARVLAIDLQEQSMSIIHPSVEFRVMDVMSLDENNSFDLIINCSTIEHVGLAGRYESPDFRDGDLAAMCRLRKAMKPQGVMLLTLPMGVDDVCAPLHRIYGEVRLPKLLDGYQVTDEMYWVKNAGNKWMPCAREQALSERGNEHYYALGCMTLNKTL